MRARWPVVITLLLLAWGLPMPAEASDAIITGTVSSANGPVRYGFMDFYPSCAAFQSGTGALVELGSPTGAYTAFLNNGTYKVRIRPNPGQGAVTSWNNAKTDCASAETVTVNGNGVIDLVALAGSNVTGTVTDSVGVPVPYGTVALYPDCSAWIDNKPASKDTFDPGDPQYRVSVLNGTYKVNIVPSPGNGFINSWHAGKTTCAAADVITVNGDTTANVVALSGFNLTGSVSSSKGVVDRGFVDFYDNCSAPPLTSSYFGGLNPTYAVTLGPGVYRAHIRPELGTNGADSWHAAKADCASADLISVTGTRTQDLVSLPPSDPTPAPTPTPPGPTPTPPSAQSVSLTVKKLKRKRKSALPATTQQGVRLTWKTRSRTCAVKKRTLKGLRKGRCTLRATAPGDASHLPYSGNFTVRIT